jgi:cytoskeletal protein CcmA (bactofilin family)
MRKNKPLLLVIICSFIFIPLVARAYDVKTGNSVYVSKDQVVDGNLYAAGQSLTIDGKVRGDVICAGQSIVINGEVEGSVICAGQSISVNGKIGGSVRAAGNVININNEVKQNAMAFGSSVILSENGKTGWDLLAAGASTDIRGTVGRDLHGAGAALNIYGKVGRNVNYYFGNEKNGKPDLIVFDKAEVKGNLIYTGNDEAEISQGAKVSGKVNKNLPKIGKSKESVMAAWARWKLYSLFSALIVGLVLVSLWRKQTEKITDLMLEKTGASIGWGLLALILTPIITVALIFTIIGLPLAFMLLFAWLIALIVSGIITGILVGRSLVERFWTKEKDSIIWPMIIGIIITQAIFSIPIIGWIFSFFSLLWGLGGLLIYFMRQS